MLARVFTITEGIDHGLNAETLVEHAPMMLEATETPHLPTSNIDESRRPITCARCTFVLVIFSLIVISISTNEISVSSVLIARHLSPNLNTQPNTDTTSTTQPGFQLEIDEYISALSQQQQSLGATLHGINFDDKQYGGLSASLIQRAFQNMTVFFIGDSLINNFVFWSHGALDYICNAGLHLDNETHAQLRANEVEQRIVGWERRQMRQLRNSTHDNFTCASANSRAKVTYSFAYSVHIYQTVDRVADIIMTNFALFHSMHIFPARILTTPDMLNYVQLQHKMNSTMQLAIESSPRVKCIFFRTPNPICDSKYTGDYRILSHFYNNVRDVNLKVFNSSECEMRLAAKMSPLRQNQFNLTLEHHELCNETVLQVKALEFASTCSALLHKAHNYSGVDAALLQDGCTYPMAFNQLGVLHARDKLIKFVAAHQTRLLREHGIKLILLDYYRIISGLSDYCQYTENADGRHYTSLLPLQMEAFANVAARHCA